ncbi:MAG: protein-tyrosine phosphatase family protein [Acidimicrobiales bacterium]
MLVTLPDGATVLARGRLGLVDEGGPRPPDYGLYLDERWRDDPAVTWAHRVIGWADFGLPDDEADLFAALADLHRRATAGELVEVACYGGVGRTGTVLACFAVLAGAPPADAVGWVRANYHPQAVETDDQAALVQRFAVAQGR